jgi:hypothetical protein
MGVDIDMIHTRDKTFGPNEAILQESMPSEIKDTVVRARSYGVAWAQIWALILQYGGQVVPIIEAIIAALSQTPPTPLPPPVVPPVSGVVAKTGKPTVRIQKKAMMAGMGKAPLKGPPGVAFVFQDNEDDTATVLGTDSAGATVDISQVASIAVTSDAPTICSVDAPVGTSFKFHGLLPGTANLTVVATWNDGSVGPFTFVLPVTVSGSAATGIVVTPGTPTVR